MSIKILLITSDHELFKKIELVYQTHIENGFFKIYSPRDVDASPNKIYYDVILTEEEYLHLIPVKNTPIIVMSKSISNPVKEENNNYIYISTPVDWQNLYDTILCLQYNVKNTLFPLNPHVPKVTPIIQSKMIEPVYTAELNNQDPLDFSLSNYEVNHKKEMNQLSTKFYNLEDLDKINKIINHYGEEHKINDKIIAQASIILDELIYTINGLNTYPALSSKEPKVLMTMLHNEHEFRLSLECLVPLNDNINNIISISQDYANTVESFKRNNSYFINMYWDF